MQMSSLAATPAAFFLPSRSTHINAGKLALIGMLVTTFFLFTAGYNFPGGALNFPEWAEAIVHGTMLPPGAAWREVGFPLLYILGGFPWSHSFIGVTLILAAFAVLMPVLVYWSLERTSLSIAFYMGVICIISLSPVMYMKFLFHDQAYMFFNLLAVALLIAFLWSGRFGLLYFFTFAAVAASFTRTAGNLTYPMLMTIAYITVRGRFHHYLGCVLIFAIAAGAYQWHRYEIFDARHQLSTPSGTGGQMFYSTYLYLGDFGNRLSPNDGPNTKRLLEELWQGVQPNPRESALIKRALTDTPPDFMEKHVYAYSPEQLFEKITTAPNEEYYMILLHVERNNDELYLNVVKEIDRSHPWYVVQYASRNLWHAVFDPGYATTRYNVQGYIKTGLDFVPGMQSWGVNSADSAAQYGPRAERELQYFPLKDKAENIQIFFHRAETLWVIYFPEYVWMTSVLIIITWVGAVLGVLCWAIPNTGLCRHVRNSGIGALTAPIIAASALLLYEDLATAMFSQPVYRYFHMTEPLRLVIAGFGVAVVTRALSSVRPTGSADSTPSRDGWNSFSPIAAIQNHDLIDGYFGSRRVRWIWGLVAVNAGLFAWWTFSMIAHTGTACPPA
jgi:hypothetical protein